MLPSVNMMSKVVVGRVPLLRPNGLDWSYPVSEEGVRMISDPSESLLRSLELHLNCTVPLGHLVTSGDSFSSLTSTDFHTIQSLLSQLHFHWTSSTLMSLEPSESPRTLEPRTN